MVQGNARCVRMSGTGNYLMVGFGGMLDKSGTWYQTHLQRGGCAVPNKAAYGAVLSSHDSVCSCYNGVRGQVALVPAVPINPIVQPTSTPTTFGNDLPSGQLNEPDYPGLAS